MPRRAHSARRVRDGADAAATELMLCAALLRGSCDGVARPAPSRSFCASRLDATRRMRPAFISPRVDATRRIRMRPAFPPVLIIFMAHRPPPGP